MIEIIKRYKWWLFAVILLGGTLALYDQWRGLREHSQDTVILAAATKHGVHPALVKAVVWRESWFNPRARGTSGEIGLMQVREPTAKDWAAATKTKYFIFGQLFDPGRNTECGTWYLRKQLDRFRNTDNPAAYALAAYNAGPSNAAKWATGAGATNSAVFLRQMDFPGTRKYVESVLRRYRKYQREFAGARGRVPS